LKAVRVPDTNPEANLKRVWLIPMFLIIKHIVQSIPVAAAADRGGKQNSAVQL
jgi:hypothetical protein